MGIFLAAAFLLWHMGDIKSGLLSTLLGNNNWTWIGSGLVWSGHYYYYWINGMETAHGGVGVMVSSFSSFATARYLPILGEYLGAYDMELDTVCLSRRYPRGWGG
jgi:hypothetical protein